MLDDLIQVSHLDVLTNILASLDTYNSKYFEKIMFLTNMFYMVKITAALNVKMVSADYLKNSLSQSLHISHVDWS